MWEIGGYGFDLSNGSMDCGWKASADRGLWEGIVRRRNTMCEKATTSRLLTQNPFNPFQSVSIRLNPFPFSSVITISPTSPDLLDSTALIVPHPGKRPPR